MKTRHAVLGVAVLAVLSRETSGQAPAPAARTITFDFDAAGSAPAGFELARTGGGAEGK